MNARQNIAALKIEITDGEFRNLDREGAAQQQPGNA
jgi:hypothetical protein